MRDWITPSDYAHRIGWTTTKYESYHVASHHIVENSPNQGDAAIDMTAV